MTCSARFAEAEVDAGGEALIMTGDRDMYQCAAERVSVVYLKQRSAGFDEVDPDEVRRRYGVVPSLVPDFIALRGDPSDGLPGRARDRRPRRRRSCWTATGPWRAPSPPPTRSARASPPRCATTPTSCCAFRDIATLRSAQVALPDDAETNLAGRGRGGAEARDAPPRGAAGGGLVA